jgi:hypothetical protein
VTCPVVQVNSPEIRSSWRLGGAVEVPKNALTSLPRTKARYHWEMFAVNRTFDLAAVYDQGFATRRPEYPVGPKSPPNRAWQP